MKLAYFIDILSSNDFLKSIASIDSSRFIDLISLHLKVYEIQDTVSN